MTTTHDPAPALDIEALACEVQKKYTEVAETPEHGFHFHTGRPLARMLGYPDAWVAATPETAVQRFAGVMSTPSGSARCPLGRRCSISAPARGSMLSKRHGRWGHPAE